MNVQYISKNTSSNQKCIIKNQYTSFRNILKELHFKSNITLIYLATTISCVVNGGHNSTDIYETCTKIYLHSDTESEKVHFLFFISKSIGVSQVNSWAGAWGSMHNKYANERIETSCTSPTDKFLREEVAQLVPVVLSCLGCILCSNLCIVYAE